MKQEKSRQLYELFNYTRMRSEQICEPLEVEDFVVQPEAAVSPPKWHLAHTTWFFEKMLLQKESGYQVFDKSFDRLFNSYYKTIGEHWRQSCRGHLSRPTVSEVFKFREKITSEISSRLENELFTDDDLKTVEIGIHHEVQHQELLLMDIKRIFSYHPVSLQYAEELLSVSQPLTERKWIEFSEDLYRFGSAAEGFYYDNETPEHKVHLNRFSISDDWVRNQEFLDFIDDGGYSNSSLWLSDGWDWVEQEKIKNPLYWRNDSGNWKEYTLHGEQNLDPNGLLCHVNYYEADAFARWKGLRLPTEFEFELLLRRDGHNHSAIHGNFHPSANESSASTLWAWTSSSYRAYPGFKPLPGSLGEYNGKFMCQQNVLRGGHWTSPKWHLRPTYRNFYRADQAWMFSGICLAKEV